MALDLAALQGLHLVARQRVTPRDVMLYALGVGLGADPLDEAQLPYVFEGVFEGALEGGLRVLPTMAITLTYPPLLAAYAEAGVVPGRVLHGEQRFEIESPLPTDAELEGETRVLGLVDKGPGRGLLVYNRTEIRDLGRGRRVATLTSGSFFLDEGGCGAGTIAPPIERLSVPAGPPDAVCDLPTLPQAALIYRLSGDWNPLHAVPKVARSAGYARPILHGRCTYGVAGHALLRALCNYEPARLRGMSARFTAPVFPGETLRTEIWRVAGGAHFRTRVLERDRVALDNGFAHIDG